jgi:sugar phosphate isomerase/epimerase
MQTRREFGKTVIATLAATGVAGGARIHSTVKGVQLGAITYSYRDLPHAPGGDATDAIIAALKADQIGIIELYSPGIEPAGPGGPGGGGGRGRSQDPEAQARAAKAREDLRQWRLATPMSHFAGVKKKFNDAGVDIFAYTINYRNDYTDPEIDKTMEQCHALGTHIIAASTQVTMAQRLVPFAEKHGIQIAFHGHANTRDSNEFATPETFAKALAMSKNYRINLDIGHFTAANYDAVAFIQENHEHITHLHMKDRKKNDGDNQEWGNGDTPIGAVLQLLRDRKYRIPALVEYEYKGTGTSTEETKKCMDFARAALA